MDEQPALETSLGGTHPTGSACRRETSCFKSVLEVLVRSWICSSGIQLHWSLDSPSLYVLLLSSPFARYWSEFYKAKALSHHDTTFIDTATEVDTQGQSFSSGISGKQGSRFILSPEPWAAPWKWSPKHSSSARRYSSGVISLAQLCSCPQDAACSLGRVIVLPGIGDGLCPLLFQNCPGRPLKISHSIQNICASCRRG